MIIKEFIPIANGKRQKVKSRKGGVLTIVNSEKNGKRVVFSETFIETMELEDTVNMGFEGNRLLVAKNVAEEGHYRLCKRGKKAVVYSAKLVGKITELMELDFSHRVSYTFFDVDVTEFQGHQVAVFSMKGVTVDGE